jgi:SAM-dependent methyltransferase
MKGEKILPDYEIVHSQREMAERSEYYDVLSSFSFIGLTLDVACGDGWIEQKNPTAISTDFALNALIRAKNNGAQYIVRSDPHNLTFKNESFKSLIILGSLEHFQFPEKVLEEVHRILKPKSFLILTVDIKHSVFYSALLKLGLFFRRPTKTFKEQPLEKKMTRKGVITLLKRKNFETLFVGQYVGAEKPIGYYLKFLSSMSNHLPKITWHKIDLFISTKN